MQEAEEVSQRRRRAWQSAQQAAELLRREFNVSRIVVFGSLARDGSFRGFDLIPVKERRFQSR